MKWLLTYLTSSIGKKQVMGATGCLLLLFMLGHMVGNLQLLLPDPADAQAAYNAYSALLTKSKLFLYTVEGGLAVIFILHVYLAITLKLQNYNARGAARYVVEARKGKKQFPSFIMIWSGLALLAFAIWHILTVRNGIHYYYINPDVADGRVVRDMWLTTVEVLGNSLFAVFYIIVMLLVGFHLWHAISSAFQTMGINHQKWTPIIDKLAIAYCVAVACGLGVTVLGTWAVVNLNGKAQSIIENAKDENYQNALKTLSQRPLDEQKKLAKIISAQPEKAKLIIEGGFRNENIKLHEFRKGGRTEKGERGERGEGPRRHGQKFEHKDRQKPIAPEAPQNPEVPQNPEDEGGEQ